MAKFRLPPRFYWDHVERDLLAGQVIRETKTYVLIEATPEEIAEIRSDADFYTDGIDHDGDPWLRSLMASAKATVRAIDKALGR